MWTRCGPGTHRAPPAGRPRRSDLLGWLVGLPGLEPGTSSLSANAGNRCAKRRSTRSLQTVGAEVMCSHGVQLCVLARLSPSCTPFRFTLTSLSFDPGWAPRSQCATRPAVAAFVLSTIRPPVSPSPFHVSHQRDVGRSSAWRTPEGGPCPPSGPSSDPRRGSCRVRPGRRSAVRHPWEAAGPRSSPLGRRFRCATGACARCPDR